MTQPRVRRRRAASAGLVIAGLLALTACSGTEAPAGTAPPASTAASTTPTSAPGVTVGRYVALGDSYSAAPGVPSTDASTVCLRSDHNYPSLVAQALSADLHDVTCSGATTADLTGSQQLGYGDPVPPQFRALTRDTELVTIGMGGNDEGLFEKLVTGEVARSQVPAAINRTRDRMVTALRQIERRAPRAQVVVVGYPQIVPPTGSCAALPLSAADFAFARRMNLALTQALQSAATTTGAAYADVWAASSGHDICAADAWINGSASTSEAIAFHPHLAEQQAVAGLVEALIANAD